MIVGGGVLDGGVGGEELGGEVGFGDGGVRAGEWVFAVAKRASPDARGVVDAGVRV